nr:MAG TPA: hypothetical protein [Caudoviricetes sp.]
MIFSHTRYIFSRWKIVETASPAATPAPRQAKAKGAR